MNSSITAERKFVANSVANSTVVPFAEQWLSHCCIPDPKFHFGKISSIYFDTPQLDSYFEKSNGDFLKAKLRLRWYDNVLPENGKKTAFLELKCKIGSGRQKKRWMLSLDADWLQNADLRDEQFHDILFEQIQNLEEPLAPHLVPTFRLYYERRRFICPASLARVCLDTAIGYDRMNKNLFANAGPGHVDFSVLEIKDTSANSETPWLEQLHRAGFYNQNFSKYGQCTAQVLQRRAFL
jgi:SPX domain protein involved in polyphosphate accumulation